MTTETTNHYNEPECESLICVIAPATDFGGDDLTISGFIYHCLEDDFRMIDLAVSRMPESRFEAYEDSDGDIIHVWEDYEAVSNIIYDNVREEPAFTNIMGLSGGNEFAGHYIYEWYDAINSELTDHQKAEFVHDYIGSAFSVGLDSEDFDPYDYVYSDEDNEEDKGEAVDLPSYWDLFNHDAISGDYSDILGAFYDWTTYQGGYRPDIAESYQTALLRHCVLELAHHAGVDTDGVDECGCTFVESLGY